MYLQRTLSPSRLSFQPGIMCIFPFPLDTLSFAGRLQMCTLLFKCLLGIMKEDNISINQQPCIYPITTVYGVFMAFFPNGDPLTDMVSGCSYTVNVETLVEYIAFQELAVLIHRFVFVRAEFIVCCLIANRMYKQRRSGYRNVCCLV